MGPGKVACSINMINKVNIIKTNNPEEASIEEKVLQVKRVSKKTKGGNSLAFTAFVAVGDKKGSIGLGLGKAKDVRTAIEKGSHKAKKNMVLINLAGHSIPHSLIVQEGAAHLIMKPAPAGSGVMAGGALRDLADLLGIRDISIKNLGTRNTFSAVHAAVSGFKKMKLIERGKK